MDISTISLAELRDLLEKIPEEIKSREVREKADVLAELRKIARERGYVIEELIGGKESAREAGRSRSKVKVKYRHPQDARLEWTGRGRKPKWVEAWTQGGGKLEQLAV